MHIFNLSIESLDGKTSKEIEVNGMKLQDFTTGRRPDISKLKEQYEKTKDKRFYKEIRDEYPIHVFIGIVCLQKPNRNSFTVVPLEDI